MQEKLPYYMAFPMPSLFGDDKQEKRDMEYLKSLYPNTVKRVLLYVEMECDKLEYDGSMIFDEYPDQLQLYMVCSRIYDKVKEEEGEPEDLAGQDVEALHRRPGGRPPHPPKPDPLRDIVQVLLYQEIMRRRCDHRRCRRNYF